MRIEMNTPMASPIPVGPARPPEVSLVVSFYNQEHLAALFLDSICCQKCACTFELLVCDDGSSDELFQLVRSFARRTQLDLRYIWQPATPEVTGRASIWRICRMSRSAIFSSSPRRTISFWPRMGAASIFSTTRRPFSRSQPSIPPPSSQSARLSAIPCAQRAQAEATRSLPPPIRRMARF